MKMCRWNIDSVVRGVGSNVIGIGLIDWIGRRLFGSKVGDGSLGCLMSLSRFLWWEITRKGLSLLVWAFIVRRCTSI